MDWMMKIIEETFPFKEGLKRGLKKGRKEGEIIGEKKGLQEAILIDIKVKFGKEKAEFSKPKIEKIDDVRKLRSLKIKVAKAKSWEEFHKYLNSNKFQRKRK